MIPLPVDVAASIAAGSVTVTPRVDLYLGAALRRASVPLSSSSAGSVTFDATATVLRTCTLHFAPDAEGEPSPLLPLLGGPVDPSGNEAYVYVDLTAESGTTVTVPLGVFGLRRPQAEQRGSSVVSVDGRDRSQRVIDAVLTAPYDVAAGTNYATAIRDLIDAAVPGLDYVGFDPSITSHVSTALHFADGDDRWRRATEMAGSIGRVLEFDTAGSLALITVTDPAGTAVTWDYGEGETNLAVDITQALDADQTYSHAAVVGQPSDGSPPIRSDAYDADPASPTYWLGPFGDRVVRLSSSYIATQAQADDAAAALLASRRGLLEDVDVAAFPVYAHEPRDVVRVASSRLGIDALYVLSRFQVPLGPATGRLTMRSRRV